MNLNKKRNIKRRKHEEYTLQKINGTNRSFASTIFTLFVACICVYMSGLVFTAFANINSQETDSIARIESEGLNPVTPDVSNVTLVVSQEMIETVAATIEYNEPIRVIRETELYGPGIETDPEVIDDGLVNGYDPENYTIKYSRPSVNVRTSPDENAEIVGVFEKNTEVKVLDQKEDGWSTIWFDSLENTMYVKSEYLADEYIVQTYTDAELEMLARVICGEARDCDDTEQLYVASVVMNRVNHPEFPNDLRSVIFQKGQYACTWDGNYYKTPTDRNWANARFILENGSILPGNVVFQSGGKQGRGVYTKTRWHYYCMR